MPAPGYRLANYDRYPANGFWGPVTANIDWCETNYEVSYYVAEFWNTVTTVAMILPPFVGAFGLFTTRHVEYRYVLPFISLIAVAIGSGLFHMTLLYEMQLLDELPMIWGTATLIYALNDVYNVKEGFNKKLATILLTGCSVSTITYLIWDYRIIFEGTYTVMVLYSIYLGIRAIKKDNSLIGLFGMSFMFYLAGFLLWCTDRLYCDQLTSVRRVLPSSFQAFTQFHALWHAFAAFGTYLFILLCLRTRLRTLSKPCHLKFGLGIFPYYELETVSYEKSF